MTPNHLVYLRGGKVKRAGEVKVGDELLTFDAEQQPDFSARRGLLRTSLLVPTTVRDVRMVRDVSIHSPLVANGKLLVDGYAVSSYSLRTGEVTAMRSMLGADVDVHAVSHMMELPVLMFYRSGIAEAA